MNRLIDADALKNHIKLFDIGCGCYEDHQKSFLNAIDAQPTIEPELQWIPCSERLPEKGQKCITCDNGKINFDTFIGHGNPYNWEWYLTDHEAWMPLPELWRGEGEPE